jgi:serine/threonine protein phosphatase PrpC
VRNSAGDPIHGGSTATLVVMTKDANGAGANLITANVGDSTAFLVPTRGTWDFLSVDHGPENQDEWQRVNRASSDPSSPCYDTKLLFVYDKTNVFRKYECPCVFQPDGTKDQQYVANPWGYGLHPTNVRYEPAVYAVTPRSVSKDSTCIAMTRALGDFYAHQFGLTHEPSISVKRISCADSGSEDTTQTHSNSYATSEQAYTIFVASDGVWDWSEQK